MTATISPLVSVLLPYRNAAATVEAAIGSLLGSGAPIEILAVDDDSTDAGPEIVRALAVRHPEILPRRAAGPGIVAALESGRAAARAPFVARMDADDLSLPGRFAAQLDLLGTDPRLGAVGTRVEPFPAEAVGSGLTRYVAWQNGLVTAEQHAQQIFVESPICHPSALFRREALDAVGGFRDVPGPEDYDLFLRLDAAGWRLAKVPELLFRWRRHPRQATFIDPRYSLERHRETKAPFLAARLERLGRPFAVWGAGVTGKRLARALEPHGARASFFVDIDPRKIGRTARGVPIVDHGALVAGMATVVVAVGAGGAREEVCARLAERGFREGDDFLAAS